MKIFNYLKEGIKGCWYFFWGHLFALFYYDKKYLTGKYFTGKPARSCVAVKTLPKNVLCEIEAIAEV